MTLKFHGTVDTLKEHLQQNGYTPSKDEIVNNGYKLTFPNGAIVNFWSSTGTVGLQGRSDLYLKSIVENLCNRNHLPSTNGTSTSISDKSIAPAKVETEGKVFVVHGHDNAAREQLELILHKLGIDHFVLQNTSGNGLTIIEALEKEIGQNAAHVKFGIVLLTPDDIGYPKLTPEDAQPRARQNVVLEMGMLLSAIGRERVAILKKGHLEVPSDASGILYLGFNDHVKETVPRLVQSLSNAGFKMRPENIANASS